MGIKDSIKGWFEGDKKKDAFREKVKEAVSDGRLDANDMQQLKALRAELDVTDAADDKTQYRREIYNEAVDAARSKGQLTATGAQELAKIQKFLALRDDQVEKTKWDLTRLRTVTDIRQGHLPKIDPTHPSVRGMQLSPGEVPHYQVPVTVEDRPSPGGYAGQRVKWATPYGINSAAGHKLLNG